ncbi:hypothetical protein [Alkaliphilus transvaalensis]|uniref:hypothetical protein n=1 Tax=Alkaliphilus transvaalensis TaxID=114628 RepID=UPI0012EC1385|nr:hypothetical protein [Alkaliphilus transvaalensis]
MIDTLQTVGTFNPIFGYIKVNDAIGEITNLTQSTLQPIIYGILVLLAFTIAFIAIALVVTSQNRYAQQ